LSLGSASCSRRAPRPVASGFASSAEQPRRTRTPSRARGRRRRGADGGSFAVSSFRSSFEGDGGLRRRQLPLGLGAGRVLARCLVEEALEVALRLLGALERLGLKNAHVEEGGEVVRVL